MPSVKRAHLGYFAELKIGGKQMGTEQGANGEKVYLFEQMPIPKAVLKLAIPTILSSLVMVLYNLADTYFVGLLNE